MLVRPITFKTLDGDTKTENFHFHLNEAEVMELELSHHGGLTGLVERVGQTNDQTKLVKEFKQLILSTYGIREGDSFLKTPEMRTYFAGHPAYSVLYMEFLTKEGALNEFIAGVLGSTSLETPEVLKAPTGPIPPPPLPPATIEAGRALANDAGM